MKISEFLSPANVLFNYRAVSKNKLLEDLGTRAAASLDLDSTKVVEQLLKREELGSTGIGGGVAIPHTRLLELTRSVGVLAKLRSSIEFNAIDGQAVDIVFVLLLPEAADNPHLGEMALVARTFRSEEIRRRARSVDNAIQLYATVISE